MGTSLNQGSPSTRNWQAAQAAYRSDQVPVERVLREVWLAATNQPEGDLAAQLADPLVARIRDIAAGGGTALEVAAAVNREIAQSRRATFAVEIARRAALQSTAAADRAQAYGERLFAEASNYLLSRDLPGHVGLGSRNQTVADSFDFKQAVIGAAADAVREVRRPEARTAEAWREYTGAVVERLRRMGR